MSVSRNIKEIFILKGGIVDCIHDWNCRENNDGYGKMNIPMKIDITTGDEITPRQIDYRYKCMFEEKSVLVKAYTLGNYPR